ncbi:allergen Asp F7 [Stagonosporopsis vannaccii]|nr:allergen Asp F7 [Stagonosporopsis vannaccii]
MKYSQVLASALFGSMAAAIPFKRDLVTKTEVAIETVIVYTTVWEDDLPVAEATTTAGGYFYEQPAAASTTPAAVSTPAYTPSPAPVQEPSSIYTPPVETPAAPSPAPVVVSSAAPAPEPVVESSSPAPAAPTTTEAAYTPAPAPATSEAAPAPAATSAAAAPEYQQASSGSVSTGESFSNVDMTINPVNGALGACGEPMNPEDITVALAQPAWGASTYDTMTGKATNKWCGQKIQIEYGGKSVVATIMDMCPGCAGHDIDLSDGAWAAIGMTEWTRVKGSWSMVN